jgi:hypothetical protein
MVGELISDRAMRCASGGLSCSVALANKTINLSCRASDRATTRGVPAGRTFTHSSLLGHYWLGMYDSRVLAQEA